MLELGKYYQQRDGLIVGHLEAHKSSTIGFEDYTFKAVGGHLSSFATRIWKADGSFHIDGSESDYDLISEVRFVPLTEQPKEEIVVNKIRLEVGKYYKDREDVVCGPLGASDDGLYQFIEPEDGLTWTIEGVHYIDETSSYDLIKEVPNPNQETEQPKQEETKAKFKEITLTEAIKVLKTSQLVYATTEAHNRVLIDRHNGIAWLLDATKFEIEVKPVVKYLVVHGDNWNTYITSKYYESIEAFYSDYDQSQYPLAELIQFTRKEF